MPLRDEGPKLRKMIISNETLKALGYEPEEFSFEIERYTEIVTEYKANYVVSGALMLIKLFYPAFYQLLRILLFPKLMEA